MTGGPDILTLQMGLKITIMESHGTGRVKPTTSARTG